jgi:hypothetical protein
VDVQFNNFFLGVLSFSVEAVVLLAPSVAGQAGNP